MASLKKSAIQLVLKAKDALSGKVRKSAESLDYLKGEAADLKDQLGKLKDQKALLSSFEKQTKATKEASKAFNEAKANVERLAKEVARSDKPTKAMQAELAKARREVKKSNTAYGRQREALGKLREQMSSAGISTSKLAQQQSRLENEIDDTANAFAKASKKAKDADRVLKKDTLKKVARDADKASGSIGGLTRRFAGLIAAGTGLYALKRGIEGILTTGDKFERMRVQLEAIMGSMAEGERALDWIKEFTKNTPFQLEEVSEAFVRLKAFGLDPMDGTMQSIIDQASKLGGGMERLNGISLAVGKAWAKQKLQGEEIMMLLERGVPVWELLEKVTGKNVQELQKLSSAGKLGRDVMKELIAEIGKSSEGAAAKNMTLLSGYVSNLKDNWSFFLDEISQSGALDYAKEQLKALANQIGIMSEDGRLSALAGKVSATFIQLGETIKSAVGDITLDDVVSKTKTGFTAITNGLTAVSSAFVVTSNSVSTFFNGFAAGVKGFASAFLYTTGEIIYGWGKLSEIANFNGLAEGALKTTDYLRSLGAAFANSAKENVKNVNESLGKIGDQITRKAGENTEKLKNNLKKNIILNKKYVDELLGNYQKTEEAVNDVAEKATAAFENIADAMQQIQATETRAELASLGVALAEALNAGTLSQEEYYEATEASHKKLQEFKKEAESTKQTLKETGDTAEDAGEQQVSAMSGATSIAGVMAGHYNAITAELQGMSSAAHDAFIAMQQGVGSVDTSEAKGSIEELKNALKATNQALSDLQHSQYSFDPSGIGRWFNETATDAAHVKKQFLEQKIALEELFESYEQGDLNARRFIRQGEHAADTMSLLNEQDLNRLNNAIRSAEQTMASLGDSSRSTLDSLQDELDQLQGRQDDIERRRYENQRNELKSQKAEAEAGGDQEAVRNLNKALRVSEQIYNERRRQTQQEKTKELQQSKGKQPITAPVSTERQTPQKIIRLEYPSGSVNVGIAPTDETKLLEALKNAGMRTI